MAYAWKNQENERALVKHQMNNQMVALREKRRTLRNRNNAEKLDLKEVNQETQKEVRRDVRSKL